MRFSEKKVFKPKFDMIYFLTQCKVKNFTLLKKWKVKASQPAFHRSCANMETCSDCKTTRNMYIIKKEQYISVTCMTQWDVVNVVRRKLPHLGTYIQFKIFTSIITPLQRLGLINTYLIQYESGWLGTHLFCNASFICNFF